MVTYFSTCPETVALRCSAKKKKKTCSENFSCEFSENTNAAIKI